MLFDPPVVPRDSLEKRGHGHGVGSDGTLRYPFDPKAYPGPGPDMAYLQQSPYEQGGYALASYYRQSAYSSVPLPYPGGAAVVRGTSVSAGSTLHSGSSHPAYDNGAHDDSAYNESVQVIRQGSMVPAAYADPQSAARPVYDNGVSYLAHDVNYYADYEAGGAVAHEGSRGHSDYDLNAYESSDAHAPEYTPSPPPSSNGTSHHSEPHELPPRARSPVGSISDASVDDDTAPRREILKVSALVHDARLAL